MKKVKPKAPSKTLDVGVLKIKKDFSEGVIRFNRDAHHGLFYKEVAKVFDNYYSQENIQKVFKNGGKFKVLLRRGINILLLTEEAYNNLIKVHRALNPKL